MKISAYTYLICSCISIMLSGCISAPPKNTDNICAIFAEKEDWYQSSKEAQEKWGISIHALMAVMHQESRFVADAKPPRRQLLGFIPWKRPSTAYGYPQALDSTWDWYLEEAGDWGADRDDFSDAADFIGWYFSVSNQQLGLKKSDLINQYLAYHEGHTGYRRKNYLKKKWLLKTSKKVSRKADLYAHQLNSCQKDLESKDWFFW